jgi:hypothetical protein
MNSGLKRVQRLEARTLDRMESWKDYHAEKMIKQAKEIMRRPGGKRYVVASVISMIGGGSNCHGQIDIATCLTRLNVADQIIRWVTKSAAECDFSEADHAAAHGAEERFNDIFRLPG